MSTTAEVLAQELENLQLPALAYNQKRLESIIDRPATSHTDLGQLFTADPGLSVALFRELGRTPQAARLTIDAPGRVIGLLGLEKVRNLTRRTPTVETRYRGPAGEGLRRCYARALHAARYAQRLATLRGRSDVEAEALAALLQGLGEMAMWARRPGTMAGMEARILRPEDLELETFKQLGTNLGDLGEALAGAWGLADRVQRVQHFANSCDANVQLPLLAAAIARCGTAGWYSPQTAEMLELAAELTQLDPDLVRSEIHKETAATARLLHAMGLPHAADRLLLPPDSPPPSPARPAAAAPRPAGETKPAPPPPAPTPASRPGKAPETAGAAPAAKPAAKTQAKSKLVAHLGKIMREMRDDLGMRRIMFAMLSPDRQSIRARYVLEAKPSGLDRFAVAAGRRNLFGVLMDKPHGLWINSGNQSKYLPYIPEQVAGLVDTHGFYAVSVVVKDRPVALFYADAGDNHTAMDADHFELFKKLCHRAGHVLGSG